MIKRVFDFTLSSLALFLLSPVVILVAVVINLAIGGPIFFSQQRPGYKAKPFRMLKFRTMSDLTDSAGNLLPDEERVSSIGRFLRSTSLDELPGLWNVLRGDMSLVGPRPLLMEYLPLYSDEQRRRHNVRPGITGWAQINGRNAITWEQKFSLDIWYVDNHSFWLDLKILALTCRKVLIREGISSSGHVTAEKFRGNGE